MSYFKTQIFTVSLGKTTKSKEIKTCRFTSQQEKSQANFTSVPTHHYSMNFNVWICISRSSIELKSSCTVKLQRCRSSVWKSTFNILPLKMFCNVCNYKRYFFHANQTSLKHQLPLGLLASNQLLFTIKHSVSESSRIHTQLKIEMQKIQISPQVASLSHKSYML